MQTTRTTIPKTTDRPPVSASTITASDKRAVFDWYWATRNLSTADLRTRLRIVLVESMLPKQPGSLLDVGCGRGSVAAHFAALGHSVTAIDISPLAVRWTERQHPMVRTAVLDLESEPLLGAFDTILCLEVLQQVRNPVAVLEKLRNALNPEGNIIVSLPNEFHLARRLSILLGHVDFGGIEDTHLKFYTPEEHRRLFDRCGLAVRMRKSQSIVPPRWAGGAFHVLCNIPANRFPGLFALSCVYHLVPQ